MKFHTTKRRQVSDVIPFTEEQFVKALNDNKPTEIFNPHYSSKVPCWTITEYLGNNRVKYFADVWSDRTPVEESLENLYRSWIFQGLQDCWT